MGSEPGPLASRIPFRPRRPGQGPGGRSLTVALLSGLLVALAVSALTASPPGCEVADRLLDAFYLLRGQRAAPDTVTIIAIDEPSIQELGLAWPWPRRVHAELIARLTEAGARLVVMDVVFAEPSNPVDDEALERALRKSGRVVLAATVDRAEDPVFSRTTLVEPLPRFKDAALDTGLALLTPDPDGTVRRFSPLLAGRPVLAAAAHARLVGRLPDKGGLIDLPGPARSVRTLSCCQILDRTAPLPKSLIEGRIVFVGRSLAAEPVLGPQAEAFRTPFTRGTGIHTPGVELQADILASLQSGRVGHVAPWWAGPLATVLILPGAAALVSRLRPLGSVMLCASGAAGTLGLSFALFVLAFAWLEPVTLVAGFFGVTALHLLDGSVRAYRERRRIRQAFSRYVSSSVVDMLLERPELLDPGGEEVPATVLFSDLAGFTGFSERMAPGQVMELLSAYFAPMTAVIKHNGGTLDKFIGDAIMAFWGAPLPDADHAANACRAALEMAGTLTSLRLGVGWGAPELTARIGIHSGRVVAGNVGSAEHVNYTCIGDTVNLASRLEPVNKHYGTGILVSGDTRALLGPGFALRRVDTIRVKGRQEPVAVHELLGENMPFPDWAALYEQGLDAYAGRDFRRARELFESVLEARPGDGPAAVMLARCRALEDAPPPPGWDGVHILDSK